VGHRGRDLLSARRKFSTFFTRTDPLLSRRLPKILSGFGYPKPRRPRDGVAVGSLASSRQTLGFMPQSAIRLEHHIDFRVPDPIFMEFRQLEAQVRRRRLWDHKKELTLNAALH